MQSDDSRSEADRLFDAVLREQAKIKAESQGKQPANGDQSPAVRYEPVDIIAAMNHQGPDIDWLVEDLWPLGRSIHVHAQRKAGKSLNSLYMACMIALGRDPYTGERIPPRKVGYWDFEMTLDDFVERLTDMGFDPVALSLMLNYYQMSALPPLDTAQGGQHLLEQAIAMGEEVIFIDTMSRVISGDENSSDTYINFYRFTGAPLKAAGISMCRLDHEGHEGGRSRGSSAKADDVDIVWQLVPTDDGVSFLKKASRINWVPDKLVVRKSDEPLAYSRANGSWPDGTKEKAAELDRLDAPTDISRRNAAIMLKDAGITVGKTIVLNAAIKYRKQRMVFP